jgi:hypothetical protein
MSAPGQFATSDSDKAEEMAPTSQNTAKTIFNIHSTSVPSGLKVEGYSRCATGQCPQRVNSGSRGWVVGMSASPPKADIA